MTILFSLNMIPIVIALILIAVTIIFLWPKKRKLCLTFPGTWESILNEKILFYKNLKEEDKSKFRNKVSAFLNEVRITGVGTEVDDPLKLLVAASAVIPVFYFEEWDYINLSEVLIYEGLVQAHQREESDSRNHILGQVRPFQTRHVLLLSRQSLESGFGNLNSQGNVGLHEFTHLLDEADGDIDGIPRLLLPPELLQAWTELMYNEIEKIKKGNSDINPYGATSRAEFFAVTSEYFFKKPYQFKTIHPELYEILSEAFRKKL